MSPANLFPSFNSSKCKLTSKLATHIPKALRSTSIRSFFLSLFYHPVWYHPRSSITFLFVPSCIEVFVKCGHYHYFSPDLVQSWINLINTNKLSDVMTLLYILNPIIPIHYYRLCKEWSNQRVWRQCKPFFTEPHHFMISCAAPPTQLKALLPFPLPGTPFLSCA